MGNLSFVLDQRISTGNSFWIWRLDCFVSVCFPDRVVCLESSSDSEIEFMWWNLFDLGVEGSPGSSKEFAIQRSNKICLDLKAGFKIFWTLQCSRKDKFFGL